MDTKPEERVKRLDTLEEMLITLEKEQESITLETEGEITQERKEGLIARLVSLGEEMDQIFAERKEIRDSFKEE